MRKLPIDVNLVANPSDVTKAAVYFSPDSETDGPAWLDDVYLSETFQP